VVGKTSEKDASIVMLMMLERRSIGRILDIDLNYIDNS
jgi:hypothetical protein